jgi:hypothetical protein
VTDRCQHVWAGYSGARECCTLCGADRDRYAISRPVAAGLLLILFCAGFALALLTSGCASRPLHRPDTQPDPAPSSSPGAAVETRERGDSYYAPPTQTQPGRTMPDPPVVEPQPPAQTWKEREAAKLAAAVSLLADEGHAVPAGLVVAWRWLRGEITGSVAEAHAALHQGLRALGPVAERLRRPVHEVLQTLGRKRAEGAS